MKSIYFVYYRSNNDHWLMDLIIKKKKEKFHKDFVTSVSMNKSKVSSSQMILPSYVVFFIFHRYCAKFELTKTRKSCGFEKEDWGRVLTMRGRTICVECQPSAMNKHLGDRCNGHGVFMKETRWNALNIPHCHGYWIMKSKHQQCTCNPNSDHSFILV